MSECPMCGCTEASCGGILGTLVHLCCRACGIWFEEECDDMSFLED